MKSYIVLYRIESLMCVTGSPFAFRCFADDSDHAEEQCVNAEPDADVVWVYEGDNPDDAYSDYYNVWCDK